jgi:hypothetical protein
MMLRKIVSAITGVSEEKYERLKQDIVELSREKKLLEIDIRQHKDAVEKLRQQALLVKTDRPTQQFLVGDGIKKGDRLLLR